MDFKPLLACGYSAVAMGLLLTGLRMNQTMPGAGNAQFTQLELASGAKKTDFTSFSFTPITQNAAFSIATLAFFQKFHQQEEIIFDELGVQSTLYWNINKTISVGPGLYYNSVSGFSERLSVLYTIRSQHFVLILDSCIIIIIQIIVHFYGSEWKKNKEQQN